MSSDGVHAEEAIKKQRTARSSGDDPLTRRVIGAFYHVYNRLDFGFLEAVYRNAMLIELDARGVHAVPEVSVAVWYEGHVVGRYRADLLVEGRVVVELKALAVPDPTAKRQLLNYLRCSDLEVGLVLNFGTRPSLERVIQTRNAGRPKG